MRSGSAGIILGRSVFGFANKVVGFAYVYQGGSRNLFRIGLDQTKQRKTHTPANISFVFLIATDSEQILTTTLTVICKNLIRSEHNGVHTFTPQNGGAGPGPTHTHTHTHRSYDYAHE